MSTADRLNVVILSEDFPPYEGGIAQWARGMARGLASHGCSVTVLARHRPEYPDYEPNDSYRIQPIRGNRWKQLRTRYFHRSYQKYCQKNGNPDLLIATTWNAARGVIRLAKKQHTPLITVAHGLEVTRKMSALKKAWLRWTLRNSDLLVAVSHFTAEMIRRDMGDLPGLRIIPNGVDAEVFKPGLDVTDLKKKIGLKDEKVILTLARVIERKGHDFVIRALPKVIQKIPGTKYLIVGPWDEKFHQQLKVLIQSLHLDNRVLFYGYCETDEIPLFYNLCDVYAMISRTLEQAGDVEGFGITYLEANACGKPVIGGDSGGVPDAVAHGETGFLVRPDDADAISDHLVTLLSDSNLAGTLGRQGRERVIQQFTWERIAETLMHESGLKS